MVNNDKAPLSLFVYLPAKTEASPIFIGASCQDKYHNGFAAHFKVMFSSCSCISSVGCKVKKKAAESVAGCLG